MNVFVISSFRAGRSEGDCGRGDAASIFICGGCGGCDAGASGTTGTGVWVDVAGADALSCFTLLTVMTSSPLPAFANTLVLLVVLLSMWAREGMGGGGEGLLAALFLGGGVGLGLMGGGGETTGAVCEFVMSDEGGGLMGASLCRVGSELCVGSCPGCLGAVGSTFVEADSFRGTGGGGLSGGITLVVESEWA